MIDKTSSFEKTLRKGERYLKTSSTVLGTAFRTLSESVFGIPMDHTQHASTLTKALGQLKGPVMKIGQFLAAVPGALPKEYASAFESLQSHAPSMGAHFVRRRMKHELGQMWETHFENFSLSPSFAASLGQVHEAWAKIDGDRVRLACKLQYPGMHDAIEADLSQLKLIFKMYEGLKGSIQTENIFKEIQERLYEELDYKKEAAHLALYRHIFSDHEYTCVPRPIKHLSTKQLLTMEWMEGVPVHSLDGAPQNVRNHIGKQLFHAWYHPLYSMGVVHGDPHPGNYKVQLQTKGEGGVILGTESEASVLQEQDALHAHYATPSFAPQQNSLNEGGGTHDSHSFKISLLDFGCVRTFSPRFVQGVVDLYQALKHNNKELLVHAYEVWGFQNLTHEMIEVMSEWAAMLFEPLLDDRIRPIQETLIGWDVASRVHEKIRALGRIAPPKEFVFMDRAAVGIGSVLLRLRAEQNWHALFEELIHDFSVKRMEQSRKNAATLHPELSFLLEF